MSFCYKFKFVIPISLQPDGETLRYLFFYLSEFIVWNIECLWCNNIGIRKSEFVAKTRFLYNNLFNIFLFLGSAEIFKPSVGQWTRIGDTNYPRYNVSKLLHDTVNRLLITHNLHHASTNLWTERHKEERLMIPDFLFFLEPFMLLLPHLRGFLL